MKLGSWITLLFLGIALFLLWQFRQTLLLVFTATVIAIALNSLVQRIQSLGVRRSSAVSLTLLLTFLLLLLFISVVLPPFLDQFQQLLQLAPKGFEQFIRWAEDLSENPPTWFPSLNLELPDLSNFLQQLEPVASNLITNFFTIFSNSLASLLQTLFVVVLTIMFLVDPLSYRQVTIRLFPSSYRRRADEIFIKCEASLVNWMGGVVINSLFVASLSALGLLVLRIRFVYAHALLAGVFNLVPNIGPAASVIFPVSVALLNAPWKALAILIWYLVVQNLESYVFSPMVMKKQVSLLPAATLTAQLFFYQLLGFLGLVLALPLAVVTKVWFEEAIIKDILDQQKPSKSANGPVNSHASDAHASAENLLTFEVGDQSETAASEIPDCPPRPTLPDSELSDENQ